MNSKLRYGIIGLMAVLLSVVFVLIGISLGATFTGRVEFLADTAATWIASLATVVIALLTIVLAIETHSMRRLQQEQIDKLQEESVRPDLDMYLKFSEAAFNFLDLVLINSGSGLAKDVRIEIDHIPGKGPNENASEIIKKISRPSFVANGISTLGPRRELSSFVISLLDFPGDENAPIMSVCLKVTIKCRDTGGRFHETVSIIDMAEFKGLSELGGRPAHDTVRQLKSISEAIGKIASGSGKVSVNTYTSVDRQEEHERLVAQRDEIRRQREVDKKGKT